MHISRINISRFLLSIISMTLICSCAYRSPYRSVRVWNQSLRDGKVEKAKSLTSKESEKYMQDTFDGIEGLAKIYENAVNTKGIGKSKKVFSSVNGNVAFVIYLVSYGDGAVKLWADQLLKEDGVWKVAPEHVRSVKIVNQ